MIKFVNIFNMNYKYWSFLKVPRLYTNCGTLCQLCLFPNYGEDMHEITAKTIQQNCGITGFYPAWKPEGIFPLIIFQFEKKFVVIPLINNILFNSWII